MNHDGTAGIWDHWDPKAYLHEFYTNVESDELETIKFLTKIAKRLPHEQKILEFGCGPTLHHIFPFIENASEIHMVDLLQCNLDEIALWIDKNRRAFNWNSFIAYTLKCEGIEHPTVADIKKRKNETQKKITKLMTGDAGKANPLGKRAHESYSTVISCYCADSATDNVDDFKRYIKNIVSLLKPGGAFVFTCLRNTAYYKVKPLLFPSANVNEQMVRTLLESDFLPESIKITVKKLQGRREQGYTSIILAYATKR